MAWKNSSRNIGRYSNDCIIEGKEILYRLKEREGERERVREREGSEALNFCDF